MQVAQIKSAKQLAQALKRVRKDQGLTQKDLALKMNMRQPTISDIENGRGTLDSLFKILIALGAQMTIETQSSSQKKQNKKISQMLDLIEG